MARRDPTATRCPVPHCGGRLVVDEDDGRRLCDLAGHVAVDPGPGPRETPDLEALIARVLTIPAAHPKEDDDD